MARKKQNGRRKRRPAGGQRRFPGIVQGVGKPAAMGFGSAPAVKLGNFFDAFHPAHLPLPRPVGPYMVVRTTTIVQTSDTFVEFCPERYVRYTTMGSKEGSAAWNTVVARSGVADVNPINAANNCNFYVDSAAAAFGDSVTLVPSAVSVQVMNPNALQTTSGICYIGRSTAQYRMAGDARPWLTLGNQFVSYMKPRLCSAAKLALRGVQIDAVPINMTDLAEFNSILGPTNSNVTTWSGTSGNPESISEPSGFTPIVVFNPDGIALQYLLTIEYRLRFDPSNPASSAHKHYPSAPSQIWDRAISHAHRAGNGAVDIADRVAQAGGAIGALGAGAMALKSIMPRLAGIGRAVPALAADVVEGAEMAAPLMLL